MSALLTSAAASTAPQVLIAARPRAGVTITNTSTSTLYINFSSSSVGSTAHAASLANGDLYETPSFYVGEPIWGQWAAGTTGYAFISEFR